MATIKEIATMANVSVATVSNVLNRKGGASPAKAEEIRSIAEQLNYTPNLLAKSLKKQKSNTIGIITEDLTVFNAPEIVDGIDEFCERNGFDIVLGNMRLFKHYGNTFTDMEKYNAILTEIINTMRSKQVEGLVYVGYHFREIKQDFDLINVPIVYTYCYSQDAAAPYVLYDDEKAAYDAAALLIENGHTKIGSICGPFGSFNTQSRLRGYQRALFDHHILYDNNLTVYGDWNRDCGYAFGERLIKHGVTAIFAHNDYMAAGVIDYCNDNGISVGRDLSVIGFDNADISKFIRPKLTSVALPLFEMGQKSAEILTQILDDKPLSSVSYKIPCKIIQRESVSQALRAGISK